MEKMTKANIFSPLCCDVSTQTFQVFKPLLGEDEEAEC